MVVVGGGNVLYHVKEVGSCLRGNWCLGEYVQRGTVRISNYHSLEITRNTVFSLVPCRPTERGGSRGKCPGVLRGPLKKFKLVWKKTGGMLCCVWWTVFNLPFLPARFHLFSHQLKFFWGGPGPWVQALVAQWDPRPATCCWMTVKSRRPDQNPSKAKKQDYFKGFFFLNYIPVLYCDFGF